MKSLLKAENIEREVLFSCLVGSHNYNLNDSNSDKDYKIFVLPTFDDLYHGKYYSSSSIGEDIDYSVHDIRKLPMLLWKANINFIETLFSEEYYTDNHNSKMWLKVLSEMANYLAKMNLPYLWDSCIGMYNTKFKSLEKGTASTQYLVETHGYDTKQAMHCYRSLDFLVRYAATNFSDFKKAIWYKDNEQAKEDIMLIKGGCYSLEKFKVMVQRKKDDMSNLENAYKSQESSVSHCMWVRDHVESIVRQTIQIGKH